jgi:hypothetical protein
MALRLAPIDGAGLDGNTPNLLRVEINMMVNLQGRSNGGRKHATVLVCHLAGIVRFETIRTGIPASNAPSFEDFAWMFSY